MIAHDIPLARRSDASPTAAAVGVCRSGGRTAGFTLAEVLAALLFLAILIPVTMQGLGVASRAGILGQRKATAIRIAERVLDEQIVTGLINISAPSGTVVENDVSYPWTVGTEAWAADGNMTLVTATVSFDVQGGTYQVAANTLYDPTPTTTTTTSTNSSATVAATP